MAVSILFMAMSLDGYIADENDVLGGKNGTRLHDWHSGGASGSASIQELNNELRACGAIVVGRRTAELMDHWGGEHPGGFPIFVPSHRPPPPPAR